MLEMVEMVHRNIVFVIDLSLSWRGDRLWGTDNGRVAPAGQAGPKWIWTTKSKGYRALGQAYVCRNTLRRASVTTCGSCCLVTHDDSAPLDKLW